MFVKQIALKDNDIIEKLYNFEEKTFVEILYSLLKSKVLTQRFNSEYEQVRLYRTSK